MGLVHKHLFLLAVEEVEDVAMFLLTTSIAALNRFGFSFIPLLV